MTKFKGLLATAAAAAMLTSTTAVAAAKPAVAHATPARASTESAHDSELGADISRGTLISIGILAALIVIVLVSVGGSNNDSPNSP